MMLSFDLEKLLCESSFNQASQIVVLLAQALAPFLNLVLLLLLNFVQLCAIIS